MIQDSKVVTRLDMDVSIPDVQKGVSIAKDENARRWIFSLTNGGEPFEVPPNWVAILTGTKPDGNHIYNGTVIDGGKIIYDFSSEDEQLNTAVGSFPVQLEIYSNVGELVFSPKLWVTVFPNVSAIQAAQSTSEFKAVSRFVADINDVNARMEQAEDTLDDVGERMTTAETDIQRMNTALNGKATKSNTLKGYGITNAYTKDEVDEMDAKKAASLAVSVNPDTYFVSFVLKSDKGETLSVANIDLPLESLIVGASYADGILSLKIKTADGSLENSTVNVNISDIVRGLVSEEAFQQAIGDIGGALDELHAYAEELKGGGA